MELKRSIELFFVRTDKNDGKQLLLGKRGPTKHGAGMYAVPGGHLEWNKQHERWETYEEAAIREVGEELGAPLVTATKKQFTEGKIRIVGVVDDMRPEGVHYLHVSVLIEVPEGVEPDDAAPDATEHTELAWTPVGRVQELLTSQKIFSPHRQSMIFFLGNIAGYGSVEGLQ